MIKFKTNNNKLLKLILRIHNSLINKKLNISNVTQYLIIKRMIYFKVKTLILN